MLWSAGSSSDCQLGIPSQQDQHTFTAVVAPLLRSADIIDIAAGALHTLFLIKSPESDQVQVVGCGDNARGQLGKVSRHVQEPALLPTLEDLSSVHASWQTSFLHLSAPDVTQSDRILSLGSNDLGELGSASTHSQDANTNVVALDKAWPFPQECFRVSKISAGPRHILALLESKASSSRSRALVGWGAGRKGELGAQRAQSHKRPVLVSLQDSPGEELQHDSIQDIVALLHHTTVLFNSPTGLQVGIYGAPKLAGPSGNRFMDLAPSLSTSASTRLFLKACWNTLFVWQCAEDQSQYTVVGAGHLGQTGIPQDAERDKKPDLQSEQRVTIDGRVSQVATGSEHTLVSMQNADGSFSVLAWGWNEHGNLGQGTLENLDTPTKVWSSQGNDGTSEAPVRVFAGNGTSFITS